MQGQQVYCSPFKLLEEKLDNALHQALEWTNCFHLFRLGSRRTRWCQIWCASHNLAEETENREANRKGWGSIRRKRGREERTEGTGEIAGFLTLSRSPHWRKMETIPLSLGGGGGETKLSLN